MSIISSNFLSKVLDSSLQKLLDVVVSSAREAVLVAWDPARGALQSNGVHLDSSLVSAPFIPVSGLVSTLFPAPEGLPCGLPPASFPSFVVQPSSVLHFL